MHSRFPFFYFLSCIVVYAICLPLLLLSLIRSKHKDSIPRRFFGVSLRLNFEPEFWFHACSFGEVRSLQPLINAILVKKPHTKILITTITHTGFHEATRLFGNSHTTNVCVKFLPFEIFLPLWAKNLTSLQSLVVTEAELWIMLFFIAKKSRAKTFLINARISDKSYGNYKYLKGFYKEIFKNIDIVLAQSTKDKKRLEELGAHSVAVFGNIKILNIPKVSTIYNKPDSLVILAASTHMGEEELIISAFVKFHKSNQDSILLLAPRHPERFTEVCQILQKAKLDFKRFSDLVAQSNLDGNIAFNYPVIVVDKLGELINMYNISDVVILGGSFVPKVGGHNPLEPAYFGVKLISGKYIYNQQALFSYVRNVTLIESKELATTLFSLDSLGNSEVEFKQNALEEILGLIM
ncbi:MAG: lipid IV(A) 3-deoxy-D-manno-octulosonic acid transferase [Helicobacter sp.]|nr:lipid IV(A) 3-deoxy-D-manno-octulosonic acid transferase [Helicobacter sp.]